MSYRQLNTFYPLIHIYNDAENNSREEEKRTALKDLAFVSVNIFSDQSLFFFGAGWRMILSDILKDVQPRRAEFTYRDFLLKQNIQLRVKCNRN